MDPRGCLLNQGSRYHEHSAWSSNARATNVASTPSLAVALLALPLSAAGDHLTPSEVLAKAVHHSLSQDHETTASSEYSWIASTKTFLLESCL